MNKQDLEHDYERTTGNGIGTVAAFLVGGLVGAGVALLLAPQSGLLTRALIEQKTVLLRGQASENLDEAVEQVRGKARQITHDLSDKAVELQERGQEMVVKQLDRASAALDGKKKVVQDL